MKVPTLKKNYEFRRVYARGKSAACPEIVLYCNKTKRDVTRIGITAGAKLGCAVKRNRVRRRLREIFRLNMDKIKPGYDLIVVVRFRGVSAPYRQLESDFLRLAGKLGILK